MDDGLTLSGVSKDACACIALVRCKLVSVHKTRPTISYSLHDY